MAWERNFEARVMKIREKELKFQKLNFTIEASVIEFHSKCTYLPSLITGSFRLYGMRSGRTQINCIYRATEHLGHQERVAHLGNIGCILAFHCYPATRPHTVYCIHFGSFFSTTPVIFLLTR